MMDCFKPNLAFLLYLPFCIQPSLSIRPITILYSKGGREIIARNLLLSLRPKVEDKLEPQRTTDVHCLLELDKRDKVE